MSFHWSIACRREKTGDFKSKVKNLVSKKKTKFRVVMAGTDGAGTNTILYKLKLRGQIVTTIPTIGKRRMQAVDAFDIYYGVFVYRV